MKPNAPEHYVDTSVFIESLTSPAKEQGRQCYRYLRRLGQIYRWVVSMPVIYEFYHSALQKSKEGSDELHDFFWCFFQDRQPRFVTTDFNSLDKLKIIHDSGHRVDFLDSLHLGIAAATCRTFVTIDNKILKNSKIGKDLGIEVFHLSSLL